MIYIIAYQEEGTGAIGTHNAPQGAPKHAPRKRDFALLVMHPTLLHGMGVNAQTVGKQVNI